MNQDETPHALEIRNLAVRLGDAIVLSDVNADIHSGEVTAVIGPNGAGKSTFLKAVLGLVPCTGTIRFLRAGGTGKERPRYGYVPQTIEFDRTAPLTVLDFFSLSAQRRPVFLGHSRRARAAAEASLARTGSCHLLPRPLGKLSGGEFQRVLLALALRDRPDVLMLDEPVSGVDVTGMELFYDILEQLHSEARFSLVLVSHDLSVVQRHADHVICLNRTVVCQGAKAQMLTPENLAAIYGDAAHLIDHAHADGSGSLHDRKER